MVQIPHNLNSFLIGIIISPPGACSPIGAKADAFLKKTNSGNTILILKQSFPSGPTAPRGKGKNFDFLFICFPVPAACGFWHRQGLKLAHFCQGYPRLEIAKIKGKNHNLILFATRSFPCFTKWHDLFYVNNKKIVPLELYNFLDYEALAY